LIVTKWQQVLCEGPNPRGADGIGTAFGRSRHNKLVSLWKLLTSRLHTSVVAWLTAHGVRQMAEPVVYCVQVFFDADGEHLRGKMCSVAITSVHAYTLYGNMVGNLSGRPTPSEEITTVL
jgi:hypothetical protein